MFSPLRAGRDLGDQSQDVASAPKGLGQQRELTVASLYQEGGVVEVGREVRLKLRGQTTVQVAAQISRS